MLTSVELGGVENARRQKQKSSYKGEGDKGEKCQVHLLEKELFQKAGQSRNL
jgi:hypothetical protein